MTEIYVAPSRRLDLPLDLIPNRAPQAFHWRLPGYAPTPLVDAPALAAQLGIAGCVSKMNLRGSNCPHSRFWAHRGRPRMRLSNGLRNGGSRWSHG